MLACQFYRLLQQREGFRIASNRRFKDNSGEWKEDVCYVGVVAWQKLAESCASKLKKGSAVYIEGELRSRTMDHDDGTRHSLVEIRAHHIQFLDKSEKADDGRLFADSDEFTETNDNQ